MKRGASSASGLTSRRLGTITRRRGQQLKKVAVYRWYDGGAARVGVVHVESVRLQPPKPSEGRHACFHVVYVLRRRLGGDGELPRAADATLRRLSDSHATDGSVICAMKQAMGATAYRSTLCLTWLTLLMSPSRARDP